MFNIAVLVTIVAVASTTGKGATPQDVATLRAVALDLGIPTGLWNFSVDPCSGSWPGIGCCTSTSTKLCCTSPAQLYNTGALSLNCETSPNASIAVVLLRSDFIKVTLNGTFSNAFCNLTLLLLDVGFNNIGGTIPACLSVQQQLQVLRLGGNKLNGTIPRELGALSNLQELFLDTLELSGEIPTSLGNLSRLTRLMLRNNQLQGVIPSELGQLQTLIMLELQVNNLTGNIPTSMSGLVSLTTLILSRNKLTGQLNGTTLNSMRSLLTLNLSTNGFSGSIPEMSIPGLTLVDLGFNEFTGGMPTFQRSPALTQLFLGHNRLSGSIPGELSASTMTFLDLSHNQLSGSVDQVLNLGTSTTGSSQSNIAFNYFQSASRVLDAQASNIQSVFNCDPGPNCRRSSEGNTRFFHVNAGGNAVSNFDADTLGPVNLGLFYGPSSRWALELSGTSGDAFGNTTIPIRGSTGNEQILYQSMRWSSSYLAYHGVGLASGNYNITLYFAEIVFDEPGYRVFDVLLNGQVWKRALDVVKEAGGPNTAYSISNTTNVNNGTLSVELLFAGKDMYIISGRFKVENNGPMISAISVIHSECCPSKTLSKALIAVPVVLGILALVLVFGCWYLLWRRRKRKNAQKQQETTVEQVGHSIDHLESSGIFTYQELYEATHGFTDKLGEGGFGAVYKGKLPNGVTIAVKQLMKNENKRVQEDFKREISILSKVRHRNLLSVLGSSLESDVHMLVTEFMPNGSLDKWLLRRRSGDSSQILNWETRKNIAIGVASGLAYLHDESTYRIIHCDIKPGNILLDSDMNPRLGDFGLARLYDEKASHVTATRLKGTAGYLAPEYAMHLQLSDKVDVYSFGVVLLELLCGRRAVDLSAPSEQCVLVDWAHREAEVPANMLDIMDKRLGNHYNQQEARDMAAIAILCTQRKPSMRPKMQTVWLMLDGNLKVPEVLANLESEMQRSGSSAENSFVEGMFFPSFGSSSQSRSVTKSE